MIVSPTKSRTGARPIAVLNAPARTETANEQIKLLASRSTLPASVQASAICDGWHDSASEHCWSCNMQPLSPTSSYLSQLTHKQEDTRSFGLGFHTALHCWSCISQLLFFFLSLSQSLLFLLTLSLSRTHTRTHHQGEGWLCIFLLVRTPWLHCFHLSNEYMRTPALNRLTDEANN
jgi:hypothetical protein